MLVNVSLLSHVRGICLVGYVTDIKIQLNLELLLVSFINRNAIFII